jgi:hypothetical protein
VRAFLAFSFDLTLRKLIDMARSVIMSAQPPSPLSDLLNDALKDATPKANF